MISLEKELKYKHVGDHLYGALIDMQMERYHLFVGFRFVKGDVELIEVSNFPGMDNETKTETFTLHRSYLDVILAASKMLEYKMSDELRGLLFSEK